MVAMVFTVSRVESSRVAAHDPAASNGSPVARDREPAVRCPHCRKPVAHPGYSRDGKTAMAECERCDALFDPTDPVRPRS